MFETKLDLGGINAFIEESIDELRCLNVERYKSSWIHLSEVESRIGVSLTVGRNISRFLFGEQYEEVRSELVGLILSNNLINMNINRMKREFNLNLLLWNSGRDIQVVLSKNNVLKSSIKVYPKVIYVCSKALDDLKLKELGIINGLRKEVNLSPLHLDDLDYSEVDRYIKRNLMIK